MGSLVNISTFILVILPVAASWLTSCQSSAELHNEPSTTPSPSAAASAPEAFATQSLSPSKEQDSLALTFYKDILPIFSSAESGKNYRCTVCHSRYSDPTVSSKPLVIEEIIKSIESGRMPPGGMRAEDFQIVKNWSKSGRQIGTPEKPGGASGQAQN